MLTVEEKYLESSFVFALLIHDEISSMTSFIWATLVIANKHIIPTSFALLINLIPITFTVVVYSNVTVVNYPTILTFKKV